MDSVWRKIREALSASTGSSLRGLPARVPA